MGEAVTKRTIDTLVSSEFLQNLELPQDVGAVIAHGYIPHQGHIKYLVGVLVLGVGQEALQSHVPGSKDKVHSPFVFKIINEKFVVQEILGLSEYDHHTVFSPRDQVFMDNYSNLLSEHCDRPELMNIGGVRVAVYKGKHSKAEITDFVYGIRS